MQQSVEQWSHLIKWHTPNGCNDYGFFSKGDCTICLYMGTNCGIYWIISACPDANHDHCECKEFDKLMKIPLSEEESEDNQWLLEAIHEKGYSFSGWKNTKYTPDVCQC